MTVYSQPGAKVIFWLMVVLPPPAPYSHLLLSNILVLVKRDRLVGEKKKALQHTSTQDHILRVRRSGRARSCLYIGNSGCHFLVSLSRDRRSSLDHLWCKKPHSL